MTATTIVIFGASGDLTHRKLIPGLFTLFCKGKLPESTRIVGVARRPYNNDTFRDHLLEGLEKNTEECDTQKWTEFAGNIVYFQGDVDQKESFQQLSEFLKNMEDGQINRLYYLSIAPELYSQTITYLGEAGMAEEDHGWRRIVIEKPFGRDLESAKELNYDLHMVFHESQIYRIDHYLGKETAQNILFFRFGNTIFEPVWNRNYIDHVQITVTEEGDIGHRAGYYDQSGVLRDMFQNHLLQLLTLVAMEPPTSFGADAVRNEKVKVLSALRPVLMSDSPDSSLIGQYTGYQETAGIPVGSRTPTYAATRLYIDNWRWQGVPFYLRSGKALKSKRSEITIQFREPPHVLFNLPAGDTLEPNLLVIAIQPDEGIHLKFEAKVPGSLQETWPVHMDFHYSEAFNNKVLPDAYERLLLDTLQGDAGLFIRSDEIEMAWHFFDPIIQYWESPDAPPPFLYEKGSWGPVEADEFIYRDRRSWFIECCDQDE